MVKSRLPDHLPDLTVMARRQPVLEVETATMNMLSQPKTHPRAWPICRTKQETSEKSKWYTRLRGRDRCHLLNNGALLPHQRSWNYGTLWHRDRPDQKPPKQWHPAAGRHSAILVTLAPGRHLSFPSRASTMPPRWGKIHCSPITHRIPTGCPPSRSLQHALRYLPGFGAPKSSRTFGWWNHRGW